VASTDTIVAENYFAISTNSTISATAAVAATNPTRFSIYVAFDGIKPVIKQVGKTQKGVG